MSRALSDEDWRTILELSETAAALPAHERPAYLNAAGAGPEIAVEVLALASQFHEEAHPVASPAVRSGARVGRFQVTGFLGGGGMGEVYSALDTELDRPVALKFLHAGAPSLEGASQKAVREAQTASSLNHPNIVTIHEIVRADSTTAIVMELVQGKPLRELCGDRSLGPRQVLAIAEQIAQALAAAHRAGIVHRDIKPENVVVQPDGRVKVLDFGLARRPSAASAGSSLSLAAGTLRYLSPEQAAAQPALPASDVFSLGLVLHELATGQHPFGDHSPLETAHAILTSSPGNLVRDSRYPDACWILLEQMLAKDPGQRPSAEEVSQRIGEICRSMESGPQHPGLWHGLTRWRLAAGAAAMAVIVLLWASTTRTNPEQFGKLSLQPLTSQPGWEAAPAFSHDGQQIAFTWSPTLQAPQVYVKRFDGEDPIQLTKMDSGRIGYLAWSPDGTRIAFKRQIGEKGGIYSIPSSGGPESLLVELAEPNTSSAIDWSPDGISLASSDQLPSTGRLAIFIYNLQTGEKTRLTNPPSNVWGDWNPKFSPDGRMVAFKRVTGFWGDDMYVVPATGGTPQRVTTMGVGVWGHAWTADGKSLLVSCQREGTVFGIWRFPLANPAWPERIQQGGYDSITPAAAARNPNRIAWVNQVWNLNIYRAGVSGSERPVALIASTQRDQAPAWSPDGRIAFVSDRSGSREIWLAKGDGSGQTRITSFKGPPIDHLMWSPDGRRLTFDSRTKGMPAVFLIECEPPQLRCSEPKTLESDAESPSWSADGKAIYYASRRSGRAEIWKRPFAGGPAQRVVQGAYYSRESLDGRWLYFTRSDKRAIYRLPLGQVGDGVDPTEASELVVGPPFRVQGAGWEVTRDELLFIDQPTKDQPAAIRAVSLSTHKVRFVRTLGEAFANRDDVSLSVSSNGKWVLYPQLDSSGSNVTVAELVR